MFSLKCSCQAPGSSGEAFCFAVEVLMVKTQQTCQTSGASFIYYITYGHVRHLWLGHSSMPDNIQHSRSEQRHFIGGLFRFGQKKWPMRVKGCEQWCKTLFGLVVEDTVLICTTKWRPLAQIAQSVVVVFYYRSKITLKQHERINISDL